MSGMASGISPVFSVSAEDFHENHYQGPTDRDIDGVHPPMILPGGGVSQAMLQLRNQWFPWIDEKIIEPKFDGVCQHLGVPSNRPSPIKDYHMLSLQRATDYLLQIRYTAIIQATVSSPGPG